MAFLAPRFSCVCTQLSVTAQLLLSSFKEDSRLSVEDFAQFIFTLSRNRSCELAALEFRGSCSGKKGR